LTISRFSGLHHVDNADHAEAVVANGDAGTAALARTVRYDPRWPWHAAAALGAQVHAASQCLRCQPARYRDLSGS
jgi:2,4-dienoyl-CoA reductase-like NADH-dependent reductase (Old Yellow Enzyme family)